MALDRSFQPLDRPNDVFEQISKFSTRGGYLRNGWSSVHVQGPIFYQVACKPKTHSDASLGKIVTAKKQIIFRSIILYQFLSEAQIRHIPTKLHHVSHRSQVYWSPPSGAIRGISALFYSGRRDLEKVSYFFKKFSKKFKLSPVKIKVYKELPSAFHFTDVGACCTWVGVIALPKSTWWLP